MNSSQPHGSALITVIIFTSMMAIMIASILGWSLTERRINGRNSYWLQASGAAEALAEYGMAQATHLYNSNPSPSNTYFDPSGSNKLQLPVWSGSSSFFTPNNSTNESYIDTNPISNAHPTGLELIATPPLYFGLDTGSGSNSVLIDANGYDNGEANSVKDLENGKYIHRRDIQILAKATAVPRDGTPPITVCVQETLSVRGDPLFSNALFYSANDLELFPYPTMDIYGPVRVNGNLFVSSQNTSLNFHGSVMVSGSIFHAWDSPAKAGDGAGGAAGEALGTHTVNFDDKSDGTGTAHSLYNSGSTLWQDSAWGGAQASTLVDTSGFYLDQTSALFSVDTSGNPTGQLNKLVTAAATASFKNYLHTTLNSVVQTGPTDTVLPYNPVGYTLPIAAPTVLNPTGLPDPHVIIDPPLVLPASTSTYYAANQAVAIGQLSNKAGLYIKVAVTSSGSMTTGDTATITLYGPAGSGSGGGSDGPNKGGGTVGGAFLGSFSVDSSGAVVAGSASGGAVPSKLIKFVPYVTDAGKVGPISGMYDRRQRSGVDLIQLDMKALNAALATVVASSATSDSILNNSGTLWGNGSNGWNGAIYVDTNQPSGGNQVAVAMVNGTVASTVVSGAVTSTASMLPKTNGYSGLTVATSAPMYVVGDFNADGLYATAGGSSGAGTTPDDGGTGAAGSPTSEVPVALCADAITLVSNNFFGTDTSTTTGGALPSAPTGTITNDSFYKSQNMGASFTSANTPVATKATIEVAAAFLTGIVPTATTGSSGGAHNLPRFVEDWTGKTVTIRGSLVSLYSSEVATRAYVGTNQVVYAAPARNWGFDLNFKNGHYPPQTPDTITFRRVFANIISPSTYKALRIASQITPPTTVPANNGGLSGGGYPSDSGSFVNF